MLWQVPRRPSSPCRALLAASGAKDALFEDFANRHVAEVSDFIAAGDEQWRNGQSSCRRYYCAGFREAVSWAGSAGGRYGNSRRKVT